MSRKYLGQARNKSAIRNEERYRAYFMKLVENQNKELLNVESTTQDKSEQTSISDNSTMADQ